VTNSESTIVEFVTLITLLHLSPVAEHTNACLYLVASVAAYAKVASIQFFPLTHHGKHAGHSERIVVAELEQIDI